VGSSGTERFNDRLDKWVPPAVVRVVTWLLP
jgi:hypothetical protein